MQLPTPDKAILSIEEVQPLLQHRVALIVDCTFHLAEPELGERQYMEAHIPGAVYAHLDRNLSGPVIGGKTGRHPVPHPVKLARTFSELGISNDSIVIAYDQGHGAFAARIWWLLRYLGHDHAYILDGGFGVWKEKGFSLERHSEMRLIRKKTFVPIVREWMLAEMQDIRDNQGSGMLLIDVRAPERYAGKHEPIDPVAGHIPGSVNIPYLSNLQDEVSWKPDTDLQEMYREVEKIRDQKTPVFYCGSGVTACHGVAAYIKAGFGMPVLYGGSWSEWITDPSNPVETE